MVGLTEAPPNTELEALYWGGDSTLIELKEAIQPPTFIPKI